MTITVGWLSEGSFFKYGFSSEWTWSEFHSARKVSEKILQSHLKNSHALVDIVIDYTQANNRFPKTTESEQALESEKKKSQNKKRKNTDLKAQNKLPFNIPEGLLSEHDWIASVNTIFIIGANSKTAKHFKTMMLPAYEWDSFMLVESIDTVIELMHRDGDNKTE